MTIGKGYVHLVSESEGRKQPEMCKTYCQNTQVVIKCYFRNI